MHENDSDDIEKIISDLYSDVSQEKPSSALDEKILSEARKELQETSSDTVQNFHTKGSGPFSGRWTVPVSLAAVIILSVTVVVTIEKERPYQLTSPPDEPVMADNDSKPDHSLAVEPMLKGMVEKEEAINQKAAKKKSKDPLVEESIKEQEVLALMQQVKPEQQQLAKKSAPTSENKPQVFDRQQDAISAQDKAARENIGSAGSGAASGSSASEPGMASAPTAAKQAMNVEEPAKMQAKRSAASEETAAEPGEFTTFATMAKPKPDEKSDESRLSTLTKRSDASDVDEPVLAEEKQQTIRSVKPESAAESPAKAFIAQSRENEIAESASQSVCASLSITDCLNSVECILESGSAGTDYQCRTAKNQCELGFSQVNDTRETCELKKGCQYKAADCFCPPSVECICGGGSPASCVPE